MSYEYKVEICKTDFLGNAFEDRSNHGPLRNGLSIDAADGWELVTMTHVQGLEPRAHGQNKHWDHDGIEIYDSYSWNLDGEPYNEYTLVFRRESLGDDKIIDDVGD